MGSVFVRARSDAHEQRILAEMHRIFKPYSKQKKNRRTKNTAHHRRYNNKLQMVARIFHAIYDTAHEIDAGTSAS